EEAAAVAAGCWHSLVLLRNGRVLSFGVGRSGQLGHGNTQDEERPVEIAGIEEAAAMSAGAFHSLVLLRDGRVLSFGFGGYGQLGHGHTQVRRLPKEIDALH